MKLRLEGADDAILDYGKSLDQRCSRTLPERPRFVDMFYAVPMPSGEVHIVKLEDLDEAVIVLDTEAHEFLSLLDGTRTLDDALVAHRERWPNSSGQAARALLKTLNQLDLIMRDATEIPVDVFGYDYAMRQERQVRFLAHFERPGSDAWGYQRKIRDARVLVLGAGGTGSQLLLHLAAAGFAHITLVDFDAVELSNLNRQLLYRHVDVGRPKAEAALERLREFNPTIEVIAHREKVGDPERLRELFGQATVCACCADVPPILLRDTINRISIETGVPTIYGGIYADHVNVGPLVVPGKSGCFRCWNEARKQRNPNYERYLQHILDVEEETGRSATNVWLYGTTGSAIAMGIGGMALELMRFVSGFALARTQGRQIKINLCTLRTTEIDWPRIASCPICGEREDTQ